MHRKSMFTDRTVGRVSLRGLAVAAIAAIVSSTWVAYGAAPMSASAAPFDPAVPMVWISQGDGDGGTLLSEAAQADGQVAFSPVGTAAQYNAIGYQRSSGYIYGMTPPLGPDPDARSHNIIRIGNDGQIEDVIGSIPVADDYDPQNSLIAGTFGEGDLADRFLVTRTANDRLYVINPNNGNYQEHDLTGPDLDSPSGASDITAAYGYLWGVATNGDAIIRIDPVNMLRREIPVPASMFDGDGSFGGAWTYGNGNLAFSNNGNGLITQIAVSNPGSNSPVFTKVSVVQGPPSGNNDGTSAPGDPADLAIIKTGPATVTEGGQISWSLTVTNNGPGGSSGYILQDALPAGVQNVSSPNLQCSISGLQVSCTGDPLLAGQTVVYTINATAPAAPATLHNAATVLGYEQDPISSNNSSSFDTVVNPVAQPGFTVTKRASTAVASPGEPVGYTVTVRNTGNVDYTEASPASFTDDLSGVLDDASYNGDASPGASVDGTTLSWSGAVAAGQSVDVTYSVTVGDAGSGDGNLANTVQPGAGGDCDVCQTGTGVRAFSITKQASTTVASPGEPVGYTVTVRNTGTVDYTEASPASFTDDLSGVLDDASYNGDASPGASVDGTTLSWSGALAAGQSVDVTYSVTVGDAGSGDGDLLNTVQPGPGGGDCDVCQTGTGLQAFSITKRSSSADATPGSVVSYTVTVRNTGTVDYTDAAPASFTDDLSGVLDDASYNGDASPGASVDGTTLSWSGALAAGQSVDVTYSVTVGDAGSGDGDLVNTVQPGVGGDCDVCQTGTGVRAFSITKQASTAVASPGESVQYTVTVQNTGDVDYTDAAPASFTDDLSGVLDDASYNGDASPGASVDGTTLSWSGALAAGQSVAVTYSVTVGDAGSGDGNLVNTVQPGTGGDCAICDTTTGLRAFSVTKQASTAIASPGDSVQYTVTVQNTGTVDYTDAAPASFTDDLSGVLDDASYNGDASPGASVDGTTLSWSGALAAGQSVAVTYSVTVGDAGSGDGDLLNTVQPGPGGGDCDVCQTGTGLRAFSIVKSASATVVVPGATVGYTVTVTNTGTVDYTDAIPASFTDDLSGVLDDATYNGDASPGAEVNGTTLTWSGALPAGETATVTYSVTVGDPGAGDGVLANTVQPGPGGGDCDVCGTTTGVQAYSVAKRATATEASIHDAVGYSVTVTNTGSVDYTAAAPASFTDDLSGVLDDAAYNDDATLGAAVDGNTLSWSGALAAGQTVTITYSVTVNAPPTGDGVMRNVVTTPTGDCAAGSTDPDCSTTTAVRAFSVLKTANTTVVDPGGVVQYTITLTNTGEADVPDASFTDDMSGVLDDATYNEDASGGAQLDGTTLSWTGPLALGQTIAITYSVTLNSPPTGDQILRNAVVTQGAGYCVPADGCTTITAGRSFTVTKTSSSSVLDPGDVVTYTVTVHNTGEADYTDQSPASFVDDLTGVLDDATYNQDASAGAAVDGSTLTWSGAVPRGGTVEVTYSFTVNAPRTGDRNMTNAVVPLGGGLCEGACSVTDAVRDYTVTKTVSTGIAVPGDVVSYTVTVRNTGNAPYTADDPATFTDDMSDVIDAATYNEDATNGAVYDAPTLSWSGAVAVGESQTITYSVTVNGPRTGDGDLDNAVVPGEGECADACGTVTQIQSFSVVKTASAEIVVPGDVLTYTVTVTNTGSVDYTDVVPASFTDDLSAVLDDATYNEDASAGAVVTGQQLSWSGPLAVGATTTITYSVTVNSPATGDRSLVNAVQPGPNGGGCDDAGDCSTETFERTFSVTKAGSVDTIALDGTMQYSILITNTGTAAYPVTEPAAFSDDLTDVLDDATYNGDATSGAVVTGSSLDWAGALEVGQTIVVTYSVTVNNPSTGDHVLRNGVVPDGAEGGECVAAQPCEVSTPIAAFHIDKQADAETAVPGQTITYTVIVSNIGQVDYTADAPASFVDDLTDVLDDAVYNDDATAGALYTEPVLSWSGPLAIGESTTITYSVTVDRPAMGDDVLDNAVVTAAGSGGECTDANPAEDCDEVTKVASYLVQKTSDAVQAAPGDVIGYTITLTNTGQVDYTAENPATFVDDMTEVIDDGVYNDDAVVVRDDSGSATPAPDLAPVFEAPLLEWGGPLAIGETVTVTYSVTLSAPALGDREATNTVIGDPDAGGDCFDAESCSPVTLIASYAVTKQASQTQVTSGDVVDYTITVTNTGQVDYTDDMPATFTDDLADVLDEAVYNDDASAGAAVESGVLTWSGALPVGASTDVTYSVTVNDDARSGALRNAVVVPAASGSVCLLGSDAADCFTDTDVVPPLATTGQDAAAWLAGGLAALLALLVGTGLLIAGARRRDSAA